jgi:hypothetical protein
MYVASRMELRLLSVMRALLILLDTHMSHAAITTRGALRHLHIELRTFSLNGGTISMLKYHEKMKANCNIA